MEDKGLKRKVDDLDDADESSDDFKIKYNKSNIEKILYGSTNKNVEVLLGHSELDDGNQWHSTATDELVERIKLYLSRQKEELQHYLAIDSDSSSLVDAAYLAQLRYSKKYEVWKLKIAPLVNYDLVTSEERYLGRQLENVATNIYGPLRHYDKSINRVHFRQAVEYARLRIKYFDLNKSNYEAYKLELNSINLGEPSIYEAHKKILEQSPSKKHKYLKEAELNGLQAADNTRCVSGGVEDQDK